MKMHLWKANAIHLFIRVMPEVTFSASVCQICTKGTLHNRPGPPPVNPQPALESMLMSVHHKQYVYFMKCIFHSWKARAHNVSSSRPVLAQQRGSFKFDTIVRNYYCWVLLADASHAAELLGTDVVCLKASWTV